MFIYNFLNEAGTVVNVADNWDHVIKNNKSFKITPLATAKMGIML
jgi:hypothetical protein